MIILNVDQFFVNGTEVIYFSGQTSRCDSVLATRDGSLCKLNQLQYNER